MKIKPFGSSSTPLFVYLVVVLGSDGDHVVLEDVGAGVSADGDGVARDDTSPNWRQMYRVCYKKEMGKNYFDFFCAKSN